MKKAIALLAVVLAVGMAAAPDADAKRLGSARSSGMQRQQVAPPAQPHAPGAPAQAAPAAGTAAAAAAPAAAATAKRSWMGPLAGLAAGLGLAALASHFGFGEALGNFMMMALLGMAVLAALAYFMRKRAATGASPAMATAGAGAAAPEFNPSTQRTQIGSALGAGAGTGAAGGVATPIRVGVIPADFDVPTFVRNAKAQFMALQAANDKADIDRLRDYLSPDMFEAAQAELRERGSATQQTEVFGLDAQVTEVVEDADRYIVSVRFTGSVRDQRDATPEDLDELWHLTKPRTGFGGWVVAGIQQAA